MYFIQFILTEKSFRFATVCMFKPRIRIHIFLNSLRCLKRRYPLAFPGKGRLAEFAGNRDPAILVSGTSDNSFAALTILHPVI